jgi:hypothetical protein
MEGLRAGARSLVRKTLWVEGCVGVLRWGLGKVTSKSIIHMDVHKPNNKLVSVLLEHFLCIDETRAKMDSQDSSRPELGGSHHLPPYSILYACPWGQHPNGILSQDSQVKVLKFPKLGLSWFWRPITLCVNLRLKWGLKQSCSLHWDPFNVMWHSTRT